MSDIWNTMGAFESWQQRTSSYLNVPQPIIKKIKFVNIFYLIILYRTCLRCLESEILWNAFESCQQPTSPYRNLTHRTATYRTVPQLIAPYRNLSQLLNTHLSLVNQPHHRTATYRTVPQLIAPYRNLSQLLIKKIKLPTALTVYSTVLCSTLE